MNRGFSDNSLNLWRDDDDSSNGNDFENIKHWNELDGDYIGDILNDDKEENTTRVYFQNLNGLKWDKQGGILDHDMSIHGSNSCRYRLLLGSQSRYIKVRDSRKDEDMSAL